MHIPLKYDDYTSFKRSLGYNVITTLLSNARLGMLRYILLVITTLLSKAGVYYDIYTSFKSWIILR